ncbi:hypothetical protein ACH4L5_07225 [Streptomyces sp. NPDC017405]|uniref:hypothetical protein n=1 Tax=unclassified Streptomyces TaxID=2593676 RepID=UPI0037B21A89
MTNPPTEFSALIYREHATLTVHMAGELDYHTSDGLAETVAAQLDAQQPPPRDVRLDSGKLGGSTPPGCPPC